MIGFSVIIPTLHRTSFLLNTLKDVVQQVFEHPFEIIIVDQSTNEDQKVLNYIKDFTFIKYHHITNFRGLPEARNYGASKAAYEFLLYIDDDIQCNSNLLTEHFKFLKESHIGVVAGGITEKFKKNTATKIGYFQKTWADTKRGFHQKGQFEIDHAGGGNFSVKKGLFDEVGGVDEHLTKGAALYEETDFCLRLKNTGHVIFYNHDAHVFHLAAATGGCRVEDIQKYLFALSRNRSIIIGRYLPWYYKITAKAYLLKLAIAYAFAYKSLSIFGPFQKGIKEGSQISRKPVKRTYFA